LPIFRSPLAGSSRLRVTRKESACANSTIEGKKTLVPLEESLKVQQVIDAIYQSAETGKEVRLGGK
jgi:predicted dehydrogenase